MRLFILPFALSLVALPACDQGSTDTSFRENIDVALSEASLSLTEAIDLAQAEHPKATVVEAALDFEHESLVYDVELYADGVEYEVYVSAADGSIVRDRQDSVDGKDMAELQAAADLVTASSGWAATIATAEGETSGTAFEVEADGDDGVLEVESLSDAGIHEVELQSDGTVVKSELSDDDDGFDDEAEQEDDEADDDHGGGADDDGGADDGK